MIDALHASRPAEPAQPILVADGPEAKTMQERGDPGIRVCKVLLAQLRSISAEDGRTWRLG